MTLCPNTANTHLFSRRFPLLRIDANRPATFCDGLKRRDFLHVGSLSALGLTLSPQMSAVAAPADGDHNCIFLFLVGGPSHIDTFDPKPNAPEEIRGPFKPTRTKVPGMQITEIFPKTAMLADHFSIVRSVNHTAAAVHDTGHQMMQTGKLFASGVEHPHVGSMVSYIKGSRNELPAHVLMPRPIGRTGGNLPHGQTAGFLGKSHDPFVLNADPSAKDFEIPDLLPPGYLPPVRTERRRKLREVVEEQFTQLDKTAQAKQLDEQFQNAYKLVSSPKTREAFDLDKEPGAVRERYGRTRFGQSCLLARRLVERGVRFVTVNMFETVFDEVTWDIHGSRPFTDISEMSRLVVPSFDQAYSALLEDLAQRGLLSSTLVTALGEFGRTPKINPAGGRDHHPGVWSALFAGSRIKGGRIVGQSDELGYAPLNRPVSPGEVASTILESLGVAPHQEVPGAQNRPVPLVDYNSPAVRELF